jgi:hypothetical protein
MKFLLQVEMALEDAPVFYRQDNGTSMTDYVKVPQPMDYESSK